MDLTLPYLLGWGLFLLLFGYAVPFLKPEPVARTGAWLVILSTTILSVVATAGEPALFRMIAIVSLQLLAMKSIVMVETYAGKPGLNFWQWLAFAMGWFGMRPVFFEQLVSKPLHGAVSLAVLGISRFLSGIGILFLSKWVENKLAGPTLLSHFLALVGLSLMLHFGILNLSASFWRFLGVNVKALFAAPFKSRSLGEFWGRRWNLAFSEMTAVVAYRPLKEKFGGKTALLCAFLLSGLLHEIAISFPVDSGYGLPLTYFVLHALAMFAERELPWMKTITGHAWLSRIWVFGWLILPMPLLFHRDFVAFVVVPLREAILMVLMDIFRN